jgi:hypothetical protein
MATSTRNTGTHPGRATPRDRRARDSLRGARGDERHRAPRRARERPRYSIAISSTSKDSAAFPGITGGELELEGAAALLGAVELGAVAQGSAILNLYGVSRLRRAAAAGGDLHVDQAGVGPDRALSLGRLGEEGVGLELLGLRRLLHALLAERLHLGVVGVAVERELLAGVRVAQAPDQEVELLVAEREGPQALLQGDAHVVEGLLVLAELPGPGGAGASPEGERRREGDEDADLPNVPAARMGAGSAQ